jgi:AcrR family transcriptional regulator
MSKTRHPTRPALSREYILDRALALIDEEGLSSFSMRKLGSEAGADPMAIYYYFPNKAALFDGIVERVYCEIDPAAFGRSEDPRERVAEGLRAMRRAFLRHPRTLPIVSTRPANTPAMAALIESFLRILEASGMSPERAMDAITCFTVYTIGHALAQAGEPLGGQESGSGRSPIEASADLPLLARALGAMGDYDPDRQFELGLRALIEGLLGYPADTALAPAPPPLVESRTRRKR